MKKTLLSILALAALVGCTDNIRAKHFGGTANVELPKGQKLVTATWKDAQLWYLYQPMSATDQPKDSYLREQSNYGVVQGTVVFHESR